MNSSSERVAVQLLEMEEGKWQELQQETTLYLQLQETTEKEYC